VTWTELLANQEVKRHKTSKRELDNLRAVIARDLAGASLEGMSTDRRFATAYNAALQAAKMAIACAGYRVHGAGHHKLSFETIKLALGKTADPYSDYFDRCRRKRNVIEYDNAQVTSETAAHERTDCSPGTLFTASSMGRVMVTIIWSMGITPLSTAWRMRGKLVSGKTETGMANAR
jgi:hypothetical protein